MVRGLNYLCAKAIQAGGEPIWLEDAPGVVLEPTMDRAREIIFESLKWGKK